MCMPMCMPMCSVQRTAYVEYFRTTARALFVRLSQAGRPLCTMSHLAKTRSHLSSPRVPPCSGSLNLRLQPTQSGGDGAAAGGADADAQPCTVEAARATLQELRGGRPFTAECAGGCAERGFAEAVRNGACSPLPTGLQLGSCASPARTWRLWAAWRPRGRETGHWAPPRPCVLRAAASNVADPTASVSTQVPPMRRANVPVLARGIGRRGRGRPVSRCTPPDGAALQHQSKATASSLKAWAPSSE